MVNVFHKYVLHSMIDDDYVDDEALLHEKKLSEDFKMRGKLTYSWNCLNCGFIEVSSTKILM